MEDLAQKLSSMLNDPNVMQQVQSVMNAMGTQPQQNSGNIPNNPIPQSSAQPASSQPLGNIANVANAFGGMDMNTINMIKNLAPLMQTINRDTDSTRLLAALRPMLSEPRQQKLDQAVKLLRLMQLLPMLKNSGILGNLL